LQEKKEGNLFLSKLIKPNNDNSIRGRKCPVKFNGSFMAWLAATMKLQLLAAGATIAMKL